MNEGTAEPFFAQIFQLSRFFEADEFAGQAGFQSDVVRSKHNQCRVTLQRHAHEADIRNLFHHDQIGRYFS